jgi:dihydroorotase
MSSSSSSSSSSTSTACSSNTSTSTSTSPSILLHPSDDFHHHLRDGDILHTTVPAAANQFQRIIVMPNLKPPVTTVIQAKEYKERIINAAHRNTKDNNTSTSTSSSSSSSSFTPLMTLYLSDHTSEQDIIDAAESGVIYGCKLYPAGATTHSADGVTDIKNIYPVLHCMAQHHIPLLIHSEVTDTHIDIFERESVFIDRYINDILHNIPTLRVVLEHITTQHAVNYIMNYYKNNDRRNIRLAATITCQHLLYNRNALFAGGINVHKYCLPVLKSEMDRQAILEAATSGLPYFFAGTDSAPHPQGNKETMCGSAGCYTSYAAVELYAEAFDSTGKIDMLDNFLSKYGSEFYRLPRNTSPMRRLVKKQWSVPLTLPLGISGQQVVPLKHELQWKFQDDHDGISAS